MWSRKNSLITSRAGKKYYRQAGIPHCINKDGDQLICSNYSQKDFRAKVESDELAMNMPATCIVKKQMTVLEYMSNSRTDRILLPLGTITTGVLLVPLGIVTFVLFRVSKVTAPAR